MHGQYDEALDRYDEDPALAQGRLKQIRYQLIAYDLVSHLLLDSGAAGDAAAWCRRGLELARSARITFWCPRIEANLAIARLRLGELEVGADLERARTTAGRTPRVSSSHAAWRDWPSWRSRAATPRHA